MQHNFEHGLALGRSLSRLDHVEDRTRRLERTTAKIEQELAAWRSWGRRGLILAAIWGSLGLAGGNADLVSTILATGLKQLLR